jgi:hypothetical protein
MQTTKEHFAEKFESIAKMQAEVFAMDLPPELENCFLATIDVIHFMTFPKGFLDELSEAVRGT